MESTNDGYGKRCLVSAIDYLHHEHGSTGRGLTDYLGAAIWPGQQREYRQGDFVIFNDGGKSFKRIRTVIVKARSLAQRDLEERYPEIAAANAVAAQKEEAAAARKRQLLAELERERMVRHAKGDTNATYILCPRAPEPPTPERLAA